MDITREPRIELEAEGDRRVFRLTIGVAVTLVAILTAVSVVIWNRYDGAVIMFVPIHVLEWSFAGGMVSVLYRLAMRRGIPTGRLELYGWAIAKPIVGLFMGSLVYFIALVAAKLLDGNPEALKGALWINVVAFVGAFSEDLSVGLIHRFVRRRLGEDIKDEEKVGRREPLADARPPADA